MIHSIGSLVLFAPLSLSLLADIFFSLVLDILLAARFFIVSVVVSKRLKALDFLLKD